MTRANQVRCCPCGATHTCSEWEALPLLAVYGGLHVRLDVRTCRCGRVVASPMPDTASVCMSCGSWIDGGVKTITPVGAHCATCGPGAAIDCQRYSRVA